MGGDREREEDGGNEEPEAHEANLLANAGVCVSVCVCSTARKRSLTIRIRP